MTAAASVLQLKFPTPTARALAPAPKWELSELTGRMTEISHGGLSVACWLLLDAQKNGEPCAWVTAVESTFFPPDLAKAGADLDALPVIAVKSAAEGARAASRLLRSGAFGLVVLDLGPCPGLVAALQGRLAALALKHDAALVLLTEKTPDAPSVGSMVSLRMQVKRQGFNVRLQALKDKRRGPGWALEEVVSGPAGLR
ncbi:MAG: hypothetical protein QM723_12405 [Myxococcaceae bacterium]